MNDFPKLCAELVEDVSYLLGCVDDGDIDPACIAECRQDLARARAALSEPLPPRVGHVLRLAEIIRELDGNHDKGADALAEAILSHPGIADVPALSEPVVGAAAPTTADIDALWLATWSDEKQCYDVEAFARTLLARFGTTPHPANSESPTAGELEVMAKMFGLEVNDWAALSWLVVTCIAAYGDSNTWKSTWKSIKSAPRDGTEILACDYDSIEIVSYDSHPSGMGNAWITRDGEEFYPDWYVDILEHPLLRHESLLTPIAVEIPGRRPL